MKINIYVDWSNEEILQEKHKEEKIKYIADDLRSEQDVANDILSDDFTYAECFYFEKEQRERVNDMIENAITRRAKEIFDDRYEEITLEI